MNSIIMQHFILITIFLVITTLLFVHKTVGLNKATTLSLHIASQRKVYIIYATLISLGVIFVVVHGFFWLSPRHKLGTSFDIGLIVAAVSVLVAAWIPDVAGWKRSLHYAASYGIVGSFIVMSTAIVFSDTLLTSKLFAILVLISEVVMVGMLFWAPRAKQYFLIYQALYIFGFLSLLLLVTYIG